MHRTWLVLSCCLATVVGCVARRSLPAPAPGVRCLREEKLFPEPVTDGLKFATASAQQTWKLARFDSADVALVEDPEGCGRVSRALGPVPPGPEIPGRERRPTYSDVVVVRLGRAGYLVSSFWHISKAGEFLCDRALVSPRFTDTRWLCG